MTKTTIARTVCCAALCSFAYSAHANVCDIASNDKVQAGAATAGVGAGTGATLTAAGVSAVTHSSGALIVTSAGSGYVAGTLGAVGAVTAVLTAPATIIVGGVIAVGIGGTALYCALKE